MSWVLAWIDIDRLGCVLRGLVSSGVSDENCGSLDSLSGILVADISSVPLLRAWLA